MLLIASVVDIASKAFRVPYTVALVVAGLILGLTGLYGNVRLSEPVILLGLLPPLVFEGALNVHLAELRRRWIQVGALAVLGTILTAVGIAGVLIVVPGMPASAAWLIAVILAPTDPVSVLAIFKTAGVPDGLRTLLEGESLFNDALGLVLYVVAVELVFPGRSPITALDIAADFGRAVGYGTLVGLIVGWIAHHLMATMHDHLIETTLSIVTAYGSYLLADNVHGSGIIATIVAGLLIGNYDKDRAMSPDSRSTVLAFWQSITFLANSALFLLIGLGFHISSLDDRRTILALAAAVVMMLATRAVLVWGLLPPFCRRRSDAAPPVPRPWKAAIYWGGLRGGIPIALVLGLEGRQVGSLNAEPIVFALVLFSLVVQGVTYKPLLRRLGLLAPVGEQADMGNERTIIGEGSDG